MSLISYVWCVLSNRNRIKLITIIYHNKENKDNIYKVRSIGGRYYLLITFDRFALLSFLIK